MMEEKKYNLYIVGGFVRDKLLGVNSKDIDYAFEFTNKYRFDSRHNDPERFYTEMNELLVENGEFKIYLETPDCFTTRAQFLTGINKGLFADFVMCRKEVYEDSDTRAPKVEMGSLYDDLQRRDFTVNAMAIDEYGVLIDPFKGSDALKRKVLECPINAETSFMDDPLRAIRCLRFAVTKGFQIGNDCKIALQDKDMWEKFDKVVSRERVREELLTMFKFNTIETLAALREELDEDIVKNVVLKDDMWLKPTVEKR